MQAYSQTITKKEFIAELKKHQKADNFQKGGYWDGQKGCAVGCSLKSLDTVKKLGLTDFSQHKDYETHLGIPEWLARVEDGLFEGMSLKKSKEWPVKFAEAIKEGADLEKAKYPFLIMILEHTLVSMDKTKYDKKKWPQVTAAITGSKAAVKLMIEAHKLAIKGDNWARSAAGSEAYSAADLAADSARSAADSARSAAYSADSARSAADSARSAADSAVYSAADLAADSARSAADSARSAAYSADSARSAAYDYYADRLLEILKDCK
jgi:hypothetical protein